MTESKRLYELYEYVSDLEAVARNEGKELLNRWLELQSGSYAGYDDWDSFNKEYTRVWTEYLITSKYIEILWELCQKIWDMEQDAWYRENEWAKEAKAV